MREMSLENIPVELLLHLPAINELGGYIFGIPWKCFMIQIP